jgi:DNA-binding transcriptional LysR family regulator
VELRQLAAFVAVADERHFGRAAERLGTVQPAVSQLVRRLERELDVLLFDRSSHHVALTGVGHELLPIARQALSARDAIAETAAAAVRGAQGVLRIGTSVGIGVNLNLLLARFAERRPRAQVRLQSMHTPGKLRALRGGDLDLAFLRVPPATPGVHTVELWSEALVAVLPASHPLSAADEVRLEHLSSLPLILGPASSNPGVRAQLLTLCRDRGLEPRLGPALGDLQEAFGVISTGAAWTLLTETNALAPPVGIAVRPIAGAPARTSVDLAWRGSGTDALVRAFVELAVQARDAGDLLPSGTQIS